MTVHRSDRLRASTALTHPLVRLSVLDTQSNRYAKKSRPERCVTSYYEGANPSVDYILPVLTQPCGGACSPLRPVWEESVIFNEETHHFLKERVLFFELLDFTSSVAVGASDHIRERSGSTPWLKIAWAFLRPSQHLIGQKCRLQLYKYEKKLRCPTDGVEVHVHTWVSFCSPFIHSSVEGAMKLKLAPFCSPYENLLQLYV